MKKNILATLALALLPFLGKADDNSVQNFDRAILRNNSMLFTEGRDIFRYDTFGDEAFWGDALKLHLALAGANSPRSCSVCSHTRSVPASSAIVWAELGTSWRWTIFSAVRPRT